MQRGRRLAFDFGDVRIGVAVSDADSILATPLTTLSTKNIELWDEIFNIYAEYQPVAVYVGRPVHLAGHESDSTHKAEIFAKELAERFEVSVLMVDERLSTVSAQRQLREAGVESRDSRKLIDQAAAVEILTLAIESEKSRERRAGND